MRYIWPTGYGRCSLISRILCTALVLLIMVALLASCGGRTARKKSIRKNFKGSGSVMSLLKAQYRDWKGVRYRMGGMSKKGVDCSGFVNLTFNRLGKKIPRTTKALAKYGKKIRKSTLRPGDLVFFKTGRRVRHVGIYYGNNSFLHASTSKGVMVSKLDNVYWKKKYWHSRRMP